MAAPKTRPTTASVSAYIDALPDPQQRADCRRLVQLMSRSTGEKPVLWGPSIVGFGIYHYVYASGTTGDWPLTGFAPRGKDLTLYLMDGFERRAAALKQLGRHKTGKCCLYVKSLADLDLKLLESMVGDSVKTMRARYPATVAVAAPVTTPVTSGRSARKSVSKTSAATKATRATGARARTSKTTARKAAATKVTSNKAARSRHQ
jgi:hypothetical protein